MKPLFLAQVAGQLVAVDKEVVVGVGRRDSAIKPVEENGRQYLPLPHGAKAVICDLQTLLNGPGATPAGKREYYLIVAQEEQLLALTMTGKGTMIMADIAGASPLPPAFTGQSRQVAPNVLVNCADLILLADLKALLATTDPETECGCRQADDSISLSQSN